jgi:hypothetical protein
MVRRPSEEEARGLDTGAPSYGGVRSPTNDRQGLGGREQGPTKADHLRMVCRRGGTGAARRLFYHIRSLPYSVSCMAEGQSDPAEEEEAKD